MKKLMFLVVLFCISKSHASGGFNNDKYGNIGTLSPYSTIVSSSGLGPVTSSVTYVTGEYNYITNITIVAYATGTVTGSPTVATCTSANLLGSPSFDFATAMAVGTAQQLNIQFSNPLRATNASDSTYITCPIQAGIRWNVNLGYYRTN